MATANDTTLNSYTRLPTQQFTPPPTFKPITSITPEDLAETTPFSITPQVAPTAISGLGASLETQSAEFVKSLEADAEGAREDKSDSFEQLMEAVNSSIGESEAKDKAYAKTVDPLKAELNEINQQILAEQVGLRRRVEALRKNPQGLYGGALEDAIYDIERESISKQADLAVIQMARQGRYDSAKEIADRAVSALLEKQRMRNDALRFNYEENKELFTTAEQRLFETKQADREREQNRFEQEKRDISDLSLNALKNGAPAAIASKMRQAATVDEAIRIGGQYVDALSRKQTLASISAANLSARKNLIELATLGDQTAIDQLGYDPRNLPMDAASYEDAKSFIEKDIEIVKNAKQNDIGLQSSSGLIRSPWFENYGGIFGVPYAASRKQDFLSDASYVVKNLTFEKIKELAAKGIKLTPISERELKAMGDASNVLVSAARFDDDGNLTGFNMSEGKVRDHLDKVLTHYQNALDDINANALLSDDDLNEIKRI